MSGERDVADVVSQVPGAPASSHESAPGADSLAAHKAKFSELLRKQAEGDKLEKAVADTARDEKKKERAAKKPKQEKVAAEAEKPAETTEDPAEAPQEVARDPEAEKLRAKLLLAGSPKKALESLSDQEVREWWQKQEERERAQSLALERASAAEKKLAALEETTEKSEQGVPTDGPDLEEIASELADRFGEEESGALLGALKVLVAPMARELEEVKSLINAAREKGVQDISQRNRDRLAQKLPSLKENDAAWQILQAQVLETFQKEPSKFSSAEDAFDHVFNAVYGPVLEAQAETKAEVQQDAAKEKARIAASTPTPPGSTRREKRPTPYDAAFDAWKVLNKNPDDLEGAKRAYSAARLTQ